MLRTLQIVTLSAAFALLAACGGGGVAAPGSTPASAPPSVPVPTPTPPVAAEPTPRGLPVGSIASARIGPAGGVLASSDGSLSLTVPAAALDREYTISMQAIQNLAHGAKGRAWRIEPEGLVSALPMTLSFKLSEQDLSGSALGVMNIATQNAQGRWLAYRSPHRDSASNTLSVSTTHFSDWSVIAGAQLKPGASEVVVNQGLDLRIVDCPLLSGDPNSPTALIGACATQPLLPGELSNWAVNGISGGSAGVGSIVAAPDSGIATSPVARYTAPNVPPASNPVAVSVNYTRLAPGATPLILVSRLRVVPLANCAWLHNLNELDYEVEMGYEFSSSAGGGSLSLKQSGLIRGQMQRVFDNDLMGVWQGVTNEGHVELNDTWSLGQQSERMFGSGQPVAQGEHASGAQLTVDYTNCTYTIQARMSVMGSSGKPNDPPEPKRVGSMLRGNERIYTTFLGGEMPMPSRSEYSPLGSYAPGGLAYSRLVDEGSTEPGAAGEARVRWQVLPR
jgi:hypothetical protein